VPDEVERSISAANKLSSFFVGASVDRRANLNRRNTEAECRLRSSSQSCLHYDWRKGATEGYCDDATAAFTRQRRSIVLEDCTQIA
jgi:hypothetical protein